MLLLLGIYTEKNIRLFSYAELRSATDNFNRTNKVGRGGFGTVYKVVLVSSIIYRKKKQMPLFSLQSECSLLFILASPGESCVVFA
jgi:hypothetical protein